MPLKTGDDYITSIQALDLEANVLGQRSGDLTGHDIVRPSLRAVAATYDGAHDDATRALFRAHSPSSARTSTASPICTRAPTTWSTRCSCSATVATEPAAASSAAWAWMRPTPSTA
jgi:aromatic ring hydroxylase